MYITEGGRPVLGPDSRLAGRKSVVDRIVNQTIRGT